jgi:hypothetical protein
LSHSTSPIFVKGFRDRLSWTISLAGLAGTMILLISNHDPSDLCLLSR